MRFLARFLMAVALAACAMRAEAASPAIVEPELAAAALEIHQHLESSGLLLGDADLDRYIQSVADRLFAVGNPNGLSRPRLRVIKGASPNAFALPDGGIYVTTELLIRLRSEAQLATVLSHELVHYTQQHGSRQQKAEGRRNTASMLFTLVTAGLAASATGSAPVGRSVALFTDRSSQLWALASISGYSRDLEREADRIGFDMLRAAGFDVREAPAAFDVLDDGADGQAGSHPKFASHPKLTERRASYEALVAETVTAGGTVQAANGGSPGDWIARIGDLPKRQLRVKLEQRDFAAGVQLAELVVRAYPDDVEVHYLMGEMLRLSRQPEARSIEAYERAVSREGAPPDAWRQLGYLYRRTGDESKAARAFSNYLQLVPDATEAPLLRGFIERTLTPTPSAGSIQ